MNRNTEDGNDSGTSLISGNPVQDSRNMVMDITCCYLWMIVNDIFVSSFKNGDTPEKGDAPDIDSMTDLVLKIIQKTYPMTSRLKGNSKPNNRIPILFELLANADDCSDAANVGDWSKAPTASYLSIISSSIRMRRNQNEIDAEPSIQIKLPKGDAEKTRSDILRDIYEREVPDRAYIPLIMAIKWANGMKTSINRVCMHNERPIEKYGPLVDDVGYIRNGKKIDHILSESNFEALLNMVYSADAVLVPVEGCTAFGGTLGKNSALRMLYTQCAGEYNLDITDDGNGNVVLSTGTSSLPNLLILSPDADEILSEMKKLIGVNVYSESPSICRYICSTESGNFNMSISPMTGGKDVLYNMIKEQAFDYVIVIDARKMLVSEVERCVYNIRKVIDTGKKANNSVLSTICVGKELKIVDCVQKLDVQNYIETLIATSKIHYIEFSNLLKWMAGMSDSEIGIVLRTAVNDVLRNMC